MYGRRFKLLLILLAVAYAVACCVIVLPPLLKSGDFVGACNSLFVNPYTTAHWLDATSTWGVLVVWVSYEAWRYRIRHGWIALVLGVFPGVATGLALYLLLRAEQRMEVIQPPP